MKPRKFEIQLIITMLKLFGSLNLRALISSSCRYSKSETLCSVKRLSSVANINAPPDPTGKKKKVEYISLIGTDRTMTYTTLEEATKLSSRRGLKLVKTTDFDKKRKCAVYQVFTGAQYLNEDIRMKKATKKQPTGYKSEKIVALSNRISNNDVESKIKQILKWIQKDHQVRATVSGSEPQDQQSERIYTLIESMIGNQARILQKRNSGNDIKFQIVPLKKDKTKDVNTDDKTSKDVNTDDKTS